MNIYINREDKWTLDGCIFNSSSVGLVRLGINGTKTGSGTLAVMAWTSLGLFRYDILFSSSRLSSDCRRSGHVDLFFALYLPFLPMFWRFWTLFSFLSSSADEWSRNLFFPIVDIFQKSCFVKGITDKQIMFIYIRVYLLIRRWELGSIWLIYKPKDNFRRK